VHPTTKMSLRGSEATAAICFSPFSSIRFHNFVFSVSMVSPFSIFVFSRFTGFPLEFTPAQAGAGMTYYLRSMIYDLRLSILRFPSRSLAFARDEKYLTRLRLAAPPGRRRSWWMPRISFSIFEGAGLGRREFRNFVSIGACVFFVFQFPFSKEPGKAPGKDASCTLPQSFSASRDSRGPLQL
jgi:uncharacterized membrane protein